MIDREAPDTSHPLISMTPDAHWVRRCRLSEALQVRCLGCGYTLLQGIHVGPAVYDHALEEEELDLGREEEELDPGLQDSDLSGPDRIWVGIIQLAHTRRTWDATSLDGVWLRGAALAVDTMEEARAYIAEALDRGCPREADPHYALTSSVVQPDDLWPYPLSPAPPRT